MEGRFSTEGGAAPPGGGGHLGHVFRGQVPNTKPVCRI